MILKIAANAQGVYSPTDYIYNISSDTLQSNLWEPDERRIRVFTTCKSVISGTDLIGVNAKMENKLQIITKKVADNDQSFNPGDVYYDNSNNNKVFIIVSTQKEQQTELSVVDIKMYDYSYIFNSYAITVNSTNLKQLITANVDDRCNVIIPDQLLNCIVSGYNFIGQNLLEVIEFFAQTLDFGFYCFLNADNLIEFKMFTGVDQTIRANKKYEFTPALSNIIKLTFKQSKEQYVGKVVCEIRMAPGVQGLNYYFKTFTNPRGDIFPSIAKYIQIQADAESVVYTNSDGTSYTEITYTDASRRETEERAYGQASSYFKDSNTDTAEIETIPLPANYEEFISLGDTIRVYDRNMKLTSVIDTTQNNIRTITPVFGNRAMTMMDKFKRI